LEGVVPDTYSKLVQVFERAVDESQSGLSLDDRIEIARIYMEFMQESCTSVAVLRNTEASLKAKGLLNISKKKN
jgi:hypothetical protein